MTEDFKPIYNRGVSDSGLHIGHKPPGSYRGDNLTPAPEQSPRPISIVPDTYQPKTRQQIEEDILASRAAANKNDPRYNLRHETPTNADKQTKRIDSTS